MATFSELREVLRSKEPTLTSEELNTIYNCQSKMIRDVAVANVIGAAASWLATRRLNYSSRFGLSVGGSCFLGFWALRSSFHSGIDRILSMEGTRMQAELANIVVRKYGDDSSMLRLISKHFYQEEVIDDSTTDKPKLRWRQRHFWFDYYSDGKKATENKPQNPSSNKQTAVEPKKVSVNLAVSMTADPLDCIFGYSEDNCRPDTTSSKPKTHSRRHKRLQRCRARQQREEAAKLQHA